MQVLRNLRAAIERGKGCPATPKVTLSVEFARELEETLVHLNSRQITDEMVRLKFDGQCG